MSARALQRTVSLWMMAQQTFAAVLAWLIATSVIGHEEPFFAPMSAVVALNATLGERGLNAVRLLLGVVVGIVVGELTIALLGRGYGRLAVATFVAMAIARALNANRIVIAQAAAGAILTVVALGGAQVGFERLIDAFIGGGIALVFTQILFAPEPVRLLRRAEAAGLAAVAETLAMTAEAIDDDDARLAERTLQRVQDVRNELIDVERATRASSRVHRHTVSWRRRSSAAELRDEGTRARGLVLLGSSCLMLARIAVATSPGESRVLVPSIRDLARVIGKLATTLDDHEARQRAATRTLELARALFRDGPQPPLATSTMLLQIVAIDFMTFLGIASADAVAGMREESGDAR